MKKVFIKALIVIECIITTQADSIVDPTYSYQQFYIQFSRNYTGDEKEHHKQIFDLNYAELQRMNEEGGDYRVNDFMDWNQTQLEKYNNFRPQDIGFPLYSTSTLTSSALFASPSSFDWRALDRVTSIKEQGICGACWSFSTTAQYESLIAIATKGTKYDLSEQYALECETSPGSYACQGGLPLNALNLYKNTGIPLQSSYPYKQTSNYYKIRSRPICNDANRVKLAKNITKIQHFTSLTTQQIQQYLVSYGPMSVGVYSSGFQFLYAGESGRISCTRASRVNHAVLLVGYNQTHWIIKNSWGTDWGHKGYGYISKNNDCHLATFIDVMEVDFDQTPTPTPTPTPNNTNVTLTITMTDSAKNGWNRNVLGIKQNNQMIGTFGSTFTSGSSAGPINVTINGKLQTQVVVYQYGTKTQQIGFTIKFATNGTVVHTRFSGTAFASTTIFKTFCALGGCPTNPNVTYYVTMSDSAGDGWNGNVLAFRQNDTASGKAVVQKFALSSGYSRGPQAFTFKKQFTVQIVVNKLKKKTNEVGFTVRTADGVIVFERAPGSAYFANSILGTFCPGCLNLSPVSSFGLQQDQQSNQQTKINNSLLQIQKYRNLFIAVCTISPIAIVFLVSLIIALIKLKILATQLKLYRSTNQEDKKEASNIQLDQKAQNIPQKIDNS